MTFGKAVSWFLLAIKDFANMMNIAPRLKLPNMTTTSHVWFFKFKLIKIKWSEKFSSSVTLSTFQVLSSHKWWAATILDIRYWLPYQTYYISTLGERSTEQCCLELAFILPAALGKCPISQIPYQVSLSLSILIPITCSWLTILLPASSETDLLSQCCHGGPDARPQHGTSSRLSPSCSLLDQLWTHSILSLLFSSHWRVSPPTKPFPAFLKGPALL